MSIVGLYDWDMNQYIHVPPNITLMKLSAYYKKHHTIAGLTKDFAPDKFTDFYVQKEYDDKSFPRELFKPNIHRGGHAFTGPTYKPMDEEIERMIPDTSCYDIMASTFGTNQKYRDMFKTLQRAEHLRISLDGKNIWDDLEKQIKNPHSTCYFFHDYDLNKIEGSRECVQEFLSRNGGYVYFGNRFPIQVSNAEDLLKWSNMKIMRENFSIQYNGLMPDDLFVEWLKAQSGTSMSAQLYYNITKNCKGEIEFVERVLPKIFFQAVYSRINYKKILLTYDDNFFVNKEWEKVIRFFNCFIKGLLSIKKSRRGIVKEYYATMYDFCSCLTDNFMWAPNTEFTHTGAKEIFQFVKEKRPDVYKQFYEISSVSLKGGELVDDSDRITKSYYTVQLID